jgi:regulatory protein
LAADRPGKSPRPPTPLKVRAVALLARREYSRAELRDKLVVGGDRNADAMAEIDAVLDELAALGYLSDTRFAKAFVQQKSGEYSKRAIGATLKAKGVSSEAATEALAGSEIDDQDAMVALWRRRFGKVPLDDREKARQVRFLQSRGFSLSAIFKLLRNPPSPDDVES